VVSKAIAREFERAARDQIRNALRRAGLSINKKLSTEQSTRALVYPRGLRGERLADWILVGEVVSVRRATRVRHTKSQSPNPPKEGTMAKVKIKSSSKAAGAKKGGTAVKKGTGAKKATGAVKAASSANRRSAADIDKLVPQFKKHLTGGGTMKALKAEHGFSSDVPIREALARAGFDSKGKKLSLEEIPGSGKKLATAVAKARREGEAWYILALRTGKTEAELKTLLGEHGFGDEASGRKYAMAAGGR
jgi:hypothetical protein